MKSAAKKIITSLVAGCRRGCHQSSSGLLPIQNTLSASFQKHPFAVTTENEHYAWKTNDRRNPQFIRQLVYHKDAFNLAAQAARIGQTVSQLTLPAEFYRLAYL